jgi:hypothetical protein
MAKEIAAPFNVPKIDLDKFISVCPLYPREDTQPTINSEGRVVSVDALVVAVPVRQAVMQLNSKVVYSGRIP